jgi:small-conductance mechanosensitive channel
MNILGTTIRYLYFLAGQTWVRNLGLLIAISIIAYLPAWICGRPLRKYRERPQAVRSRVGRFAVELLEASLWPLWAILLLYSGFEVWIYIAHEVAGNPFHVLPILWFFLLFRILIAVTKELLPPGPPRRRIRKGVIPLVFILAVLQQLDLLAPLMHWMDLPFLHVGTAKISMISFLTAIIILAIFVLVARLIATFLRSRFLPGLGMDRNVSESLATLLRYGLVVIGIFVAVDSLGFDLTTLKIALGALGIGIGFGLQNVVNNIVSGFIILIERTVKKDDMIVVGGADGRVISIGLRSSVVRTRAGHEIIVPNSELVTSPVTNFSYHDRLVRVDVQVGVSYSADPNQVRDLLLSAAHEEGRVLDQPQPDILFKQYGDSSIDFELRVWIDDPWQIPQVRSALYFSIWYKLKTAGIEVPFPQRDLHVRDEEIRVRIEPPEERPRVPEAQENSSTSRSITVSSR